MTRNHGSLKGLIVPMEAFLGKGNPVGAGGVVVGQRVRVKKVHPNCFRHPPMQIIAILVI